MEFVKSEKVSKLLENYPRTAQAKLNQLRKLIVATAEETEGVDKLVESTKWGEPSYLTKTGTTIRMDWKAKTPDTYYLYFICSTQLVNTFRIIFGDELEFEGDRAIVLDLKEPMPSIALKRCITLALNYQKVKHSPMLGV
jgi:hypothetical protein